MNDYIRPEDKNIIEVGCGAGLSKFFINNDSNFPHEISLKKLYI